MVLFVNCLISILAQLPALCTSALLSSVVAVLLELQMAVPVNWGPFLLGVPIIRALLFGVFFRAPDFWKLLDISTEHAKRKLRTGVWGNSGM